MIMHAEINSVVVPGPLESLFAARLITYKEDQLTVDPDIMSLLDT